MVTGLDHARNAAFFAWPGEGGVDAPLLSVVAPMYNEAGGAALLVAEVSAALASVRHEIIIVGIKADVPQLRIIRHEQNAGQSRAIRTGVLAARAPLIAMLDGDGQNNPADILALFEKFRAMQGDLAMVAGERQARQDTAAKRWASSLANGLRRRLLNDGAADTGCGLKVFSREAYLRLPYFDHMHRYLPALMRREGFGIEFMPVSHRPRAYGVSKYTNFGRLVVAIRDLCGVLWLIARSRSPKSIYEQED